MSSSKCVLARILQIPFTTHRSRGTSENACNFEVRTSVIVKVMGTADELGVVTRTCEGNTKFPGENTQNKQVSFPPPPAATFMDSLKLPMEPRREPQSGSQATFQRVRSRTEKNVSKGLGFLAQVNPGLAARHCVTQARLLGSLCLSSLVFQAGAAGGLCPRGHSGAARPDSPRRQPDLAVHVLSGAVQNLPSCGHRPPVFGSPVSGGRWDSR